MGERAKASFKPVAARTGRTFKVSMAGRLRRFFGKQVNLDEVKKYIENQEEHHGKMSFQDEVRILLKKHDVEWDEAYIWE